MIIRTEIAELEVEHDGAFFLCRDLSTTELTEIAFETKDDQVKSFKISFLRTVLKWRKVKDMKGKEFICTDENKELFFENNHNAVQSILSKFAALRMVIGEEEKKSLKSSANSISRKKSGAVQHVSV